MILDFLFLIIIIISSIVVVCIVESKKQILKRKRRAKDNAYNPKFLKKFKTDVFFNDYPTDFNVENRYDCNASSLRICKIDDPTTLFGCKEINVRCRHFDKPQKYIDADGNETIIPANSNNNEGYALAISTIVNSCNPYHGTMVLVKTSRESKDYMLICKCFKDGYIGNDDLLGNCTTVRICGGKVVNINVEIEKIKCDCPLGKYSYTFNNAVPSCRELTIHEANTRFRDWSFLVNFPYVRNGYMPTKYYDVTIRDNVNVRQLLSTCNYSLINPTEYIPPEECYFDAVKNSCVYRGYHLPVQKSLLQQTEAQTEREKANYKDDLKCFAMYDAVIQTRRHEYYILSDHVLGKRQIAAIVTSAPFLNNSFNKFQRIVIGSDVGFSRKGILFPKPDEGLYEKLLRGQCFHYNIGINYYCNLTKKQCTFYPDTGLPKATSEYCCPWGYGDWDEAYDYQNAFKDLGYGVEFKPSRAQKYEHRVKFYGLVFVPRYSNALKFAKNLTNGPISFSDEYTWSKFRELNDEV